VLREIRSLLSLMRHEYSSKTSPGVHAEAPAALLWIKAGAAPGDRNRLCYVVVHFPYGGQQTARANAQQEQNKGEEQERYREVQNGGGGKAVEPAKRVWKDAYDGQKETFIDTCLKGDS
jgi:hypothetical protein